MIVLQKEGLGWRRAPECSGKSRCDDLSCGAGAQCPENRKFHRLRKEPDGAVSQEARCATWMTTEDLFGNLVIDGAVVVGKAVVATGPLATLFCRPINVLQHQEGL